MSQDLEQRVAALEERNQRVEGDKAWETSWFRKTLIAFLTYVIVVIYSWAIGGSDPALTALVPVTGYLLSTITASFFKKRWLNRRK